jgi:malonate transporter and related proteins
VVRPPAAPPVFDAFTNSVLPVFAMVGLGALAFALKVFSVSQADTLSRFVYFFAGPVLLFRLIATADFASFNLLQIGAYLVAEFIVFGLAYTICRHGFRRDVRESLLLAMTSVFANHVLYLLPIATYQFGEARAAAIVTFIAGDLIVLYGALLILLDATDPTLNGASIAGVARRMATNPQLIALALGLLTNLIGIPIGGGFAVFAQFLSGAASPVSLFALGIVLMSQRGIGDLRVSLSVTALKLLVMPAVLTLFLLFILRIDMNEAGLALLIASAPSGVMTFVLAMRYGIPSQDIGRATMFATLFSTLSVSVMLQVL